jgi:exonuclease VII large subunit
MTRSAQVRSLDALQAYAAVLRSFGDEATTALSELEMEVYRAVQWIRHDQKEYWTQQIRRAETEVAEARINLERRRMFRIGDHRPSCDEEKAALEAAKRRLRIAQQKREAVRRWGQQLERELTDYRGGIAPLSAWLQTELPKGLALLQRLGRALESYVHAESAVEAGLPPDTSAAAEGEAAGALGELAAPSPPREPRPEDTPRPTAEEDAPATSQEPGRCASGT